MDDAIQDLLETSPELPAVAAQLLLREQYETIFGIHNHEVINPNRPFSLVAQHWEEDSSYGCLLFERIEQFEERQIFKRFGLSLTEFLDLPKEICVKLLEVAAKKQKEELSIAENLNQRLNNAGGVGS